MRVTIHQPEHLPWLGFFDKVSRADMLVVLDNVQFRKNYFQNRNKIRTAEGWAWFTVPVRHSLDTLIKDVTISTDKKWLKKWGGSLYQAYCNAPYFKDYFPAIESVAHSHSGLCGLNVALIRSVCDALKISVDVRLASEIRAEGKGSDLILDICKKTGCSAYLSGISGRDYLVTEDFAKAGIPVEFQEFHHPIYRQLHEPFIPCMSVLDLLFNHGPQSLSIIRGVGVPVMKEVFL